MSDIETKMKLQSAEFSAAHVLAKAYTRLAHTPVVDGDYPEMRHHYELSVHDFLAACKANGRSVT